MYSNILFATKSRFQSTTARETNNQFHFHLWQPKQALHLVLFYRIPKLLSCIPDPEKPKDKRNIILKTD